MNLKQVKINTDSELIEMVQLFEKNEKTWLYRGHANANWDLLSSLERFCINYCIRLENIPKIEDRIIRHFCCIEKERKLVFDTLLEKMIYLQHNGCATRLIDVTTNFSKACFFALYDIALNTSPDSMCCIWCFNQKDIDDSINNSELKEFYQCTNEYKIKTDIANQLFGENLTNSKGLLLIGDWADSAHQIPQNGMAILDLDIKNPTFQPLLKLYGMQSESLNKKVVDFNAECFMELLDANDILQIIIKNRPLLVNCEKLICRHFNLNLKSLFPNGINSELADLNKYIKSF